MAQPKVRLTVAVVGKTGNFQKDVANLHTFMKRGFDAAFESITKKSTSEMGKVSKDIKNLIPPDFYKRAEAASAILGEFGSAMSSELNVAGNKLKDFIQPGIASIFIPFQPFL